MEQQPDLEPSCELGAFEQALRIDIGAHRYRIGFETGARIQCCAQRVTVATETLFQAEWITRHLRSNLEQVAKQLFGNAVTVEIAVAVAAADAERGALPVAAALATPSTGNQREIEPALVASAPIRRVSASVR